MSQTLFSFRMPTEIKEQLEEICGEMGLSLSTAFNLFARKVVYERKIPFEITADPFHSKANQEHLTRGIAALKAGKDWEKHDLIDD